MAADNDPFAKSRTLLRNDPGASLSGILPSRRRCANGRGQRQDSAIPD